ncbi:phosphatidylinositol-binding protein scs2 [Mortierella polycephala]|uniref:Phosphatidylinositol-binding protein scs2 n=1 Tax=Mortierella polycephala TaxID=41804 RepID=A0A9P6Q2D1_9FUNG|nr:phosphatidylinositol-binding protein scs2 [Mortierella polycephala]
MSIELDPASQLSFRRPLTEAIKQTLIIRNPTQLPIAFKVKTTAPKQYCVRPNSGRVEPGQELEVQVQMQAMRQEPPADFKCKDKFLVQSIAITAEREKIPPTELWPTIEREAKDQIREKKIRCAFLPPVEHAITQIQEEEESGSAPSIPPPAYVALMQTQQQQTQQQQQPAETASVHSAGSSIHTQGNAFLSASSTSSTTDIVTLRRELEDAQQMISNLKSSVEKLQSESSTLRQRKPELNSSLSAPTMTAVHLNISQGYPVTYVAGAAVVAFIFGYLFF